MSKSAEAKLQELRGKTNRDLASLISHRLDRGMTFARVLENDRQDWASTEHFRANAELAYADACRWLSLLSGACSFEKRRLEIRLNELRATLDSVVRLRAQAAC